MSPGTFLFTPYTTPLNKPIRAFSGVSHHLNADDTHIYISVSPHTASSNLHTLQQCPFCLQDWMNKNELKLNPDKPEFTVLGSHSDGEKLQKFFRPNIMGSVTYTQQILVFLFQLGPSQFLSKQCLLSLPTEDLCIFLCEL